MAMHRSAQIRPPPAMGIQHPRNPVFLLNLQQNAALTTRSSPGI